MVEPAKPNWRHKEQGGKAQQGDSFLWLSTFQSSSSDHTLSKRSGRVFPFFFPPLMPVGPIWELVFLICLKNTLVFTIPPPRLTKSESSNYGQRTVPPPLARLLPSICRKNQFSSLRTASSDRKNCRNQTPSINLILLICRSLNKVSLSSLVNQHQLFSKTSVFLLHILHLHSRR